MCILQSLLNFLMPKLFEAQMESLRAIFKVKSNNHTSLLSRERISRAKQMMTPFILRRRKDQVRPLRPSVLYTELTPCFRC